MKFRREIILTDTLLNIFVLGVVEPFSPLATKYWIR